MPGHARPHASKIRTSPNVQTLQTKNRTEGAAGSVACCHIASQRATYEGEYQAEKREKRSLHDEPPPLFFPPALSFYPPLSNVLIR